MKRLTLLLTLVIFALTAQGLWAQSGKLSFQGVLRDSDGRSVPDSPPNYDLTFKFYTAATGNTQVGSDIVKSVEVENGVYSVILDAADLTGIDFDTDYYVGTVYDGNEFPNRVEMTAAPYALSLLGTDNKFPGSGDVVVGGTGNVGIGTTSPSAKLEIGAPLAVEEDMRIGLKMATSGGQTFLRYGRLGSNPDEFVEICKNYKRTSSGYTQDNSSSGSQSIGFYSDGNLSFSTSPAGSNPALRLLIAANGNVGIGTTNPPSATLDVVGTVEMIGSSSSYDLDADNIAPSDGFVTAYGVVYAGGIHIRIEGVVGGVTIAKGYGRSEEGGAAETITFPVAKGQTWKVIITSSYNEHSITFTRFGQ